MRTERHQNRAVIISGGFKEAGPEGDALERELVKIARRYGMRLLGPNCIGVAHPRHKLNTTFMEHEGSPGFVGMASQSGSFITQIFHYLALYGMGFSSAFSVGNEADIDIVDCLEYLGACPENQGDCPLHWGIRRGRAFVKMARSIVPHKPIVALYVGGSETGRKAGLSHTGAMAGPDSLYSGVFEQCGIIRAGSVTRVV